MKRIKMIKNKEEAKTRSKLIIAIKRLGREIAVLERTVQININCLGWIRRIFQTREQSRIDVYKKRNQDIISPIYKHYFSNLPIFGSL